MDTKDSHQGKPHESLLDFAKGYAKDIPKKDRFHFGVIVVVAFIILVAAIFARDQKSAVIITGIVIIFGVCVLRLFERKNED